MYNKQPMYLKPLYLKPLCLKPTNMAWGSFQRNLAGCCTALLIFTCSGCFLGNYVPPTSVAHNRKPSASQLAAGQPTANQVSASQSAQGNLTHAQQPANEPTTALASYSQGDSYSQGGPASMQEAPATRYSPAQVSPAQYSPNMQAGMAPQAGMTPQAGVIQPVGAIHQTGAMHQAGQHEPSCSCCNRGQAYRPLFPHRFGLLACKSGCPTPHDGPCPEQACGPECEPQARCVDPQEYIFDGGDHDPPVRLREDLSQTGLDPEDTVIQYTTKGGVTEVQAGCRVAIYSPRFGSVRKRTATVQSDLALRPQTADLPTGPGLIKEKLPPIQVMVPVKVNSKDAVRVVEAFRDRQRPLPSELVLPMAVISDAFKPYEDLDIIRNGNIRTTDPAKLAIASAAARIWANVDALQVLIDGQEAAEIVDLKQAREYTLYELKGARVRICKVASEQVANPGDTVSFTIRYDNIGEQPVSNLVITDSLAPRLEYIDATQQSSLPARFSTTPNDVGSAVLRWEIDQEVKPGEGGFVRFDTKVR